MTTPSTSLRELFDIALALDTVARAGFLDRHCQDPAQRAYLERLLTAADSRDEPLSRQPAARLAAEIGDAVTELGWQPGVAIGPYTLLAMLGEGGSATVFQASRDLDGVRQDVAIKLLRRGLYSPDAQRMFRRERQSLAALSHPNIAHLIDGGTTDTGVPYLVMEFVDGRPITEYAAGHGLDLRARLRLLAVVCRAVEAAHRSLIVHRDLKPSNILVTGNGEVKLLDFGIAKLLDEEASDDAGSTRTGHAPLTPAYAAPEQFNGEPISTATDVYALGVVLHELLLGERPGRRPLQRPSLRAVEIATDDTKRVAATTTLRNALRGDLDNILFKALAEEPQRRYARAGDLADDIDRYLDARPVSAHPPSRWYRTRKFVQRHRGSVASTVAFALAIVAALAIALRQTSVAQEQARLARSQSERANATRDFVVDLLKTASAELPKDERPTPEALVAQAARDAREARDLDPLVRAQLLLTLGKVASSQGDFANAEALIDESIQRARELDLPASSPEWIEMLVTKGNLLHSSSRSQEADQLMQSLLPGLDGVDTEGAVSALMLYAATRAYAGDADIAVETAQRALLKAQRVFGADSVNGIETATYLGHLCRYLERYQVSAAILEEALPRWRRLSLPLNEQYARSLFSLAVSREKLGQRVQAEQAYIEGIDLMQRIHDGDHYRTAQGQMAYGRFLIDDDRIDEAARLFEVAHAATLSTLGNEHGQTAIALMAQGVLLKARHQHVAAEAATRSALEILSGHASESGHERDLAQAHVRLAENLLDLGRHVEVATHLAFAERVLPQHVRKDGDDIADVMRLQARLALTRGDAVAGLAAVDSALKTIATADPPVPLMAVRCRSLRADLLLALGRTDEAGMEIRQALALLERSHPAALIRRASLLAQQARVDRADGDESAAKAAIAQALTLDVQPDALSDEDRRTLWPTGR